MLHVLDDIDRAVRSAATEFTNAIFSNGWRGREREAVSLFALGHLIRQCQPGSILHSPTQIAIEAAVPGVPGLNPKGRVNKDLVIWERPGQTCWNEDWLVVNHPLAVLEWKVFRPATKAPSFSEHDREWLLHFSRDRFRFVGYLIWIDLAQRGARMAAGRVQRGSVDLDWLRL